MNLSQAKLASMMGATQQQVQRVETLVSPVSLDFANAASEALDVPIPVLFPSFEHPTMSAFESNEEALEALGQLGYILSCQFAGELKCYHHVTSFEGKRLLRNISSEIQKPGKNVQFAGFESKTHRVAINPQYLNNWVLLDQLGLQEPEYDFQAHYKNEERDGVRLYYTDGTTQLIEVYPQDVTEDERYEALERGDDEDEYLTPLSDIFFYLENYPAEPIEIEDADGDVFYINPKRLVMVELPIRYLNENLWNDFVDAYNEWLNEKHEEKEEQ